MQRKETENEVEGGCTSLSTADLFLSSTLNLIVRGILVYNIYLISISESVYDGATNKSVLFEY